MAVQRRGDIVSFKAGADLSANQYFIVRLTSAGVVGLASSATQRDIVGVLQNKPKANEPAEVLVRSASGTGKVMLGGTVAIGDDLTTDANGKAITTTTANDEVIGRALEAGAAGDIIEFIPMLSRLAIS
jgi:hypothetical protein